MINIELISPTKNAAVVRSVNGKTGEVIIEIPSIEGLATEQYVQAAIEAIDVDMTGVATEEYVAKKIAEAQLAGGDVDLSAYYTKTETDAKIDEKIAAIEIPTPEAPEIDLSGYVTTEFVENELVPAINEALEEKADIAYVDEQIAALGDNPGEGASINIDNATIIQDENGVIRTAIGGSWGEPVIGEVVYTYEDAEGIAPADGMLQLPNFSLNGEEWLGRDLEYQILAYPEGLEGAEWGAVEEWAAPLYFIVEENKWQLADPRFFIEGWMTNDGAITCDPGLPNLVVVRFIVKVPDQGGYNHIDPNFIPVNENYIFVENGQLRTRDYADVSVIEELANILEDMYSRIEGLENTPNAEEGMF